MTDLEITRLCAEAMGIVTEIVNDGDVSVVWETSHGIYRPLHDDAQAMALVKNFHLTIDTFHDGTWIVGSGWNEPHTQEMSPDLNRAICECVAKMQVAKMQVEK